MKTLSIILAIVICVAIPMDTATRGIVGSMVGMVVGLMFAK